MGTRVRWALKLNSKDLRKSGGAQSLNFGRTAMLWDRSTMGKKVGSMPPPPKSRLLSKACL